MAITFMEFIKMLRPLSEEQKEHTELLQHYLSKKDLTSAVRLMKMGKLGVHIRPPQSTRFLKDTKVPQITSACDDEQITLFCSRINNNIKTQTTEAILRDLSKEPWRIAEFVAPNLIGYDTIKKTVLIQMISDEPIHILLLGDPGVGKTDILHDAADLTPISSFGLGSGTSGVGLSALYKGDQLIQGLLPRAHNGLCCIDELNLMKDQDYASLYNAMEKGFVTYDKAGKHVQLDAKVSILATANPKGDRFGGTTVATIQKQTPFDPALLSRFHIVFLVRQPGVDEFKKISEKIVSGTGKRLSKRDKELLKMWVDRQREKDIEFPSRLKKQVSKLAEDLKKNEKNYLIEISPRIIIGIMRIAKSIAKLNKRNKVGEDDLTTAEELLFSSLKIH